MMRERDLRLEVDELIEAEMSRGDGECSGRFAGRKLPERRNNDFDQKEAAWFQVRGRVAETLDLLVLGRQVHDRIAQEVNECERPVYLRGREITGGHRDIGSALLFLQPRDHG